MKITNHLVDRVSDYTFTVPVDGRVTFSVKIGDSVRVNDVLFEKEYKKTLETYSVNKELGLYKDDPKEYLVRLNGEYVTKGEVLAERLVKGGLVVKKIFATVDGILSYERLEQGYLDILSEHTKEDVKSPFNGKILDINHSKDVSIKSRAYSLKTVTNISEKIEGKFVVLGQGNSVYTQRDLADNYEGSIVFAGRFVFAKFIEEILLRGAKCVVVWSMDYQDYEHFKEKVIVLGGFGQIPFDHTHANMINSLNGSYTCIDNEVIIFADNGQLLLKENSRRILPMLLVNTLVKIVDTDNYTSLGKVVDNSNDDGYVTVLINSGERVLYPIEVLKPID